jgi:hypothetical protein
VVRNDHLYSLVEAVQRRYVEVVVVFVAENHRVDGGKRLGSEYARRMNAIFEGVHRTELFAQEGIHQHTRPSGPHHPSLMA